MIRLIPCNVSGKAMNKYVEKLTFNDMTFPALDCLSNTSGDNHQRFIRESQKFVFVGESQKSVRESQTFLRESQKC